jgi:hypothetical protein
MLPFLVLSCLMAAPSPAGVSASYAPSWTELRETLQQMGDPQGTSRVYRKNPGLQETFSEEEAFARYIAQWRGRLLPLPARPDDLEPEIATVQVTESPAKVVVYVTFHNPEPQGRLTFLKLTWVDRSLSQVNFYTGFVQVAPKKGSHHGDSYYGSNPYYGSYGYYNRRWE